MHLLRIIQSYIGHEEFPNKDLTDEEVKNANEAPKSVYGSDHLTYYRHVPNVLEEKIEPMCMWREARKAVEIIICSYQIGKE